MFRWWRTRKSSGQSAAMIEIGRNTDLNTLMQGDLVMLFKHSPACPVSWAAYAHVTRFRSRNPAVPVYIVSVLRERAMTHLIAERTSVRHESPQVILLRRGAVVSVASHGEISADHLARMIAIDQPLPR